MSKKEKGEKLGIRKLARKEMEAFGVRRCHYCDDGTMPSLDEWTQKVADEECYVLLCAKCGLVQFFFYHR